MDVYQYIIINTYYKYYTKINKYIYIYIYVSIIKIS
jgi:hypothetical protein